MPRLPVLSGRDLVRVLREVGFEVHHQKGSHIILRQSAAPHVRLSVPDHKTLKRGLLRSLIRDAGLTREEFLELVAK